MLLTSILQKSVLDLQKSAQLFDTGYITILCIVGVCIGCPIKKFEIKTFQKFQRVVISKLFS